MNLKTDHTHEVERRVIAIPIKATDSCGFFEPRETALISAKGCRYCVHGNFQCDTADSHQSGFCKFKK